ncbi:hypothetical protein MKK63_11295 [Methylobacterium sp. J-088]|uniref:hypothetical protein n=1 Tax=unclassified Methylobacterium TaxID=2615210 RepID=UPI001FB99646|nr:MULTISPECIES: hypothetical protein [unclassified Methylobacterium]MCJ2063294.1 hypothetical protein [Methylobacterium sp. J-088]
MWWLRALYARLRGRTGLGDVQFLGTATAWTGLAQMPFGPFLALGLHGALVFTPAA